MIEAGRIGKKRRFSPSSSTGLRLGQQVTNLTKRLGRKELNPLMCQHILGLTTYGGLSLNQAENVFAVMKDSVPAIQPLPSRGSIQKVSDSLPDILLHQFGVKI